MASIISFIKDIISGPDHAFKKLTPELIAEKKQKLQPNDYRKWLRKTNAFYGAMASEIEGEGKTLPRGWIDKLNILKKELLEAGERY